MSYKILVGGYTDGGLRVLTFDPSNADKLKVAAHTIAAGSSPSWIARHPSNSSLVFAANEVEDGRVIAIKLSGVDTDEEVTGELVANVTSGGVHPAHLLVMKHSIVVANYTGGSILDLPYSTSPLILSDTSKDKREGSYIQFTGAGPNAGRQEASHPHEVYAHGDELLIPDLGADKTWRLAKGSAGWEIKGAAEYPAGTGPRHILIHDGILYTVLELTSELSLQRFTALPEAPTHIATLSIFASGSCPDPANMLAAEILLCPNKKFIYVSNRNDPSPEGDTIAVFNVPTGSEECKLVREIRTGVKHARGMSFSGDGKYLAVAGCHSGSVKMFRVVEGSVDGDITLVALIEGLEKPTSVLWL